MVTPRSASRNATGFEVIAALAAEITDDTLLESTAAEVGGLSRMADTLVRVIMRALNGGDVMSQKQEHTIQVAEALDIAAHLVTFVDHLFNALMNHRHAIVEQHEALLEIPPLVQRAREALEAARRLDPNERPA